MNRTMARSAPKRTDARVASAACIAWMLLLCVPVRADPQTRFPEHSLRRDSTAAGPDVFAGSSPVVVHHVVLGPPNGVLAGRVAAPSGGNGVGAVANLRLALVREGQAVAITRTDQSGRFALSNLSQGLYQVVVDGPGGPSRRTCRVWTPSSAPPTARAGVEMMLGEGIVRGQGPFPILSFPQAAAVAGVAAGAIAAPIIYHNVQSANRGPASP